MIKLMQMLPFIKRHKNLPITGNKTTYAVLLPNAALLTAKFCFFGLLGFSIQASALNRIQTENAQPGNSSWYEFYVLGSDPTDNIHDIEGYTDKDSVNIGQTIKFYASVNTTNDPQYTIRVYRLGWYSGYGARLMQTSPLRTSIQQSQPQPDANGMVQANWSNPYTLAIPNSWTSGVYVATITGSWTGKGRYVPFVVTDTNRSSDYLFQVATTTWQAYNAWGGKSLYGFNSTNNSPARKVSFNRPYDVGGGLGGLLSGESSLLYFMEREGYDVSYQTDIDTHKLTNGGLLNHKAVLSVGHDEYWTKAMRDNFERARAHGIGLGFFGANDAYWQIRMENAVAPLATQQNRTIVGYKDFSATEDPLALDTNPNNNNLVTSRWRNPSYANRPENALIGVMYAFGPTANGTLNTDILAAKNDPGQILADSHWIYTATGITIGAPDARFAGLLGYEADRIFDNGYTPAGLEIVAASPVPVGVIDHDSPLSVNYDPSNPKSHATVYTTPCSLLPCNNAQSTVFAVGSLQWNWGLDSGFRFGAQGENWFVMHSTRNALARMISAPLPSEIPGVLAATLANSASALNTRAALPNSMLKDNPSLRLIKAEHERNKTKVEKEAKNQDKQEAKKEQEVKGEAEIEKIK